MTRRLEGAEDRAPGQGSDSDKSRQPRKDFVKIDMVLPGEKADKTQSKIDVNGRGGAVETADLERAVIDKR